MATTLDLRSWTRRARRASIPRMRWTGGLYAALALVMGCSSSTAGVRPDAGGGKGGSDAGWDGIFLGDGGSGGGNGDDGRTRETGGDAGASCVVPVDQIDCAPTLAQQLAAHTSCPFPDDPSGLYYAGACGTYRVWQSPGYFGGVGCIYDAAGTQLVTARACSDVPEFCDNTARCKYAGAPLDPSTICEGVLLSVACGADAGR
jgi:hypothetical protein